MFPFNTFFASFSPFFLRKMKDRLTIGRGMGYYFSVWGILMLILISCIIVAGWIFVTPERATQWGEKIPAFSVTIQDGLLTETGLTDEPTLLIDSKDFVVFVSKTLTEIPQDKQGRDGFYILRDHATIIQSQGVGEKEQTFKYADVPELKNAHFDKPMLVQKIVTELSAIKRIAAMIIAFTLFFIGILVAVWYGVWCFFWALFVWLIGKSTSRQNPLQYEQAVGFVFSTFFPVIFIAFILLLAGFSFPFSTTLLFLAAYGYNHLSFHSSEAISAQ